MPPHKHLAECSEPRRLLSQGAGCVFCHFLLLRDISAKIPSEWVNTSQIVKFREIWATKVDMGLDLQIMYITHIGTKENAKRNI